MSDFRKYNIALELFIMPNIYSVLNTATRGPDVGA